MKTHRISEIRNEFHLEISINQSPQKTIKIEKLIEEKQN